MVKVVAKLKDAVDKSPFSKLAALSVIISLLEMQGCTDKILLNF